jgi:tellurium resistance protein TerD
MTVNLEKGVRVNLEKEAPGLSNLNLGLGWDIKRTDGADFDLDASLLLVGEDGKASDTDAFIFYNNTLSKCGSVVHTGDNLTGKGDGDDEVIKVNLAKLPDSVTKLVIAVTIHDADLRKQNFGQVENAFIRVVNNADNEEIIRYDLTEDYSSETSLVFGEIYKKDGNWRFVAKGEGFAGGLPAYFASYGLTT